MSESGQDDPPEQTRDGSRPDPSVGGDLTTYAAFPNLASAAAAVLSFLRAELGFRWWAVSRVTGGTYAVLTTGNSGFPLAAGEQLPWPDSLCRLAVERAAPPIAPDVRAVHVYEIAPLVHQWHVGAYLSVPITVDGTSLFGTLCAIDDTPRPLEVAARLPLVELQARLLSTVLAGDLRVEEARRARERAEVDALIDSLTGLVNRRGWQRLLDREDDRCRRYGSVASVLVADLDGLKAVNDRRGHAAGDVLLQQAASVLRDAFRSTDVVARLGGDEFGVLAVETDGADARRECDRLQGLLADAGIAASVGAAARGPEDGLTGAWASADAAMYAVKRSKRRAGPSSA